jgi:hypothetical protein
MRASSMARSNHRGWHGGVQFDVAKASSK